MGMEGKLRKMSEFDLARYRNNPDRLYEDLLGKKRMPDMSNLVAKMQNLQATPVMKRIQEKVAAGSQPDEKDLRQYKEELAAMMHSQGISLEELQADTIGRSKDGQQLALHKSWHCLHYVLTGESWEEPSTTLGRAILGGKEIPDKRRVMGYGPARYLTAKEVQETAAALGEYPFEERVKTFDPEKAEEAKVYVPDHEPEELREYFEMLRDFYAEAAKRNEAMVLWVE